jgi:hypothetical protein
VAHSASVARCLAIVALVSLGAPSLLEGGHALALTERAGAPTITVSTKVLAPHGSISVSGSGFDPSAGNHRTIVDLTLTNSTTTAAIGIMQVDGAGNLLPIPNSPLVVPLNVDTLGLNRVTAREEGNPALAASVLVGGLAVTPSLNGGQGLSAQAGATVTVKGMGFAPSETVTVSLHDQPVQQSNTPLTVLSDASGKVSASFTIPTNQAVGTTTVTFTGGVTGTGQHDQATALLTVLPQAANLIVTPNPAVIGTSARLQASGLQPNEAVTFSIKYFDLGAHSFAVVNSPATADAAGSAVALAYIPASADPTQGVTVSVRGNVSGNTFSLHMPFAQTASLSISPTSALPGAQITITGSGFVPNENLYPTTRLFKTPLGRLAVVDATGHFTATETILPSLLPGAQISVAVSGSGGDNASAEFTLANPGAPAISITTSSANEGDQLGIAGKGFGVQEAVALTLGGVPLSVNGSAPTTDATGAFTASVTLPSEIAPGAYVVRAAGATSGSAATANLSLNLAQSNHWYFAEGYTGQSPTVSFTETLTLMNPGNATATGDIEYDFPDGSTSSVPVRLQPHSLLVEDVNADIGPNHIVSEQIQTDQPIVAERTISRTNGAGKALDTDFSPGQSAAQAQWYFAEGYGGVSFQPYLTLQNPATIPVSATITLYPATGSPVSVSATIPSSGRYTLNLRSVLAGISFSTFVQASAPVVAERVEYWGDGAGSAKFGAGVKPGISSPGKTWYFSYASVHNGDQAFLSLFNPGSQAANVNVAFFNGSGSQVGTTAVTVQPGQRGTIQPSTVLTNTTILTNSTVLSNTVTGAVAAIVTSDVAIAAEETQYYGGSPNQGSHPGAAIEGRQLTATRWSFASGDTGTYQESEYIFNPGTTAATITARFIQANGQVTTASYTVGPKGVLSVDANTIRGLPASIHGSVWTSTNNVPVVITQVLLAANGQAALADQGIPG